MMAETRKIFEIEIAGVDYELDVTFYWDEGEWALDPTEGSDSEFESVEVWSVRECVPETGEWVELLGEKEWADVIKYVDFDGVFTGGL